MPNPTDRKPTGPVAPPVPGFSLGYPEVTPGFKFGPDEPTPVKLSEKYRPKSLCDVFGQGSAICQLQSFLDAPFPTAFLFDGPTGVGKTLTALALAAELGVNRDWALHTIESGEADAENVEHKIKMLRYHAPDGGWKVLVVEEADGMSPKAQMMFLTILENIPAKSVIVFTTNHADKFPDRFLDRCERIQFESNAETLSLDALSVLRNVWRSETGRDDHPALESLPNVVDRHGNVSFRRIVSALEPILRATRSAPPVQVSPDPEPASVEPTPAPDFPDPATCQADPAPDFSRPEVKPGKVKPRKIAIADVDPIILASAEAYRETGPTTQGAAGIIGTWNGLTQLDRNRINIRLMSLGCDRISKGFTSLDRFERFIVSCVYGSPVAFPTVNPPVSPVAAPDATESTPEPLVDVPVASVDTPVPSFPGVPTVESTILDAIDASRDKTAPHDRLDCIDDFGINSIDGIWRDLDKAARDEVIRFIDSMTCDHPYTLPVGQRNRFVGFVTQCVCGYHVSFPEPDPAHPVPDFSADEACRWADDAIDSALMGRSRLARVEPPTEVFDRDGRIHRAEMMAVERVIRAEMQGTLLLSEMGYDLGYIQARAALAWSRMTREEQADFLGWCRFIGYRPGEADHGKLADDEQWEVFAREVIQGAPVFFLSPRPDGPLSTDPTGHVDNDAEAPRSPQEGLRRAEAESPRAALEVATLVILVHGIGLPVIRFDTATLPQSTNTPRPGVSRLTPSRAFLSLEIGGRAYGLTVNPDGYTLEKTGGELHEVAVADDGRATCSCRDFTMRHAGLPTEGCKHIRALRAVRLLPPARGFPDPEPIPEPCHDRAARFFGMS